MKRFEALAQCELPSELQFRLQSVKNEISKLKEAAKNWGVNREFSPDGRFLGDVGELIAKIFYGVDLNVKQEKGHDATEAIVDAEAEDKRGRKVEVKLRSRSKGIEFSSIPELLLVVFVSPETLKWVEICNGPGTKLLADAKIKNGKHCTDCNKLLEAQKKLFPSDARLKRIEPQKPD
jgi:hypothetical protein